MRKILIAIIVITITSCSKDYLIKENPNELSDGSFWVTQKDAYFGVNALYNSLCTNALYAGGLNSLVGLPMFDCYGDNTYNQWQYEGAGYFMTGNIDPSYYSFSNLWTACYAGIGRANVAIKNITEMPTDVISDSIKSNLVGQARFLRALHYTNLAIYFQDVPLITKPQTLAESYVPKNTFQEVYTQIIEDLTYASNVLPVTYPASQLGYATKGAALGLMARMKLYNKDYQGVLDATSTLLTMGYTLNTNYGGLFTESGEASKEILFQVRFSTLANDNKASFSTTYGSQPKVDELPMPNLVNDYYCLNGRPIAGNPQYNAATPKVNRDPRLAATIYFKGDVFVTSSGTVFNTTPHATNYGKRKYIASSGSVGSANGQDYYVVRYADVLLMRAEALVELNQLPEVYTLVDQVRQRPTVLMPKISNAEGINLSQAALRDIVRHERRVELALEGLRFFDLKRWGLVQQAFQTAIADNIPGYAVVYRGLKSEVFPIPQSEIRANASLVQHPAW